MSDIQDTVAAIVDELIASGAERGLQVAERVVKAIYAAL